MKTLFLVIVSLLAISCSSGSPEEMKVDYRPDLRPEMGQYIPGSVDLGPRFCGDHVCDPPHETIMNCKIDCQTPAAPPPKNWFGHEDPGFVDPPSPDP